MCFEILESKNLKFKSGTAKTMSCFFVALILKVAGTAKNFCFEKLTP